MMRTHAIAIWGLALVICLGWSCAGSKKTQKRPERSSSGSGSAGMREDFNPVDLNDDDIKTEERDVRQKDIDDLLTGTTRTSTDTIGTGYRIQIIQTTDPEEAREIQKDAILRFDQEVYRVFDPPFYKVRVGDFVNWNDAETIQKLAIQKGFRDAWVIRTKVNLKRAYNTFDSR